MKVGILKIHTDLMNDPQWEAVAEELSKVFTQTDKKFNREQGCWELTGTSDLFDDVSTENGFAPPSYMAVMDREGDRVVFKEFYKG